MLSLQQLEHPYLHELFKAVLLYDAPKVKKMLAMKLKGSNKLMKKWEFDRAYQEITPSREYERYNGNIDVLWVVRNPRYAHDRAHPAGYRTILHEVKTGKHDINEIVLKYRKSHYHGVRAAQTNIPLYVWEWKKHHSYKSGNLCTDVQNFINRGAVRPLPLDWLLPILEKRMGEIFKWTEKQ